MSQEIRYVCTGGCGGSVSEEEYSRGKTTCGTPECRKYQEPFVKRMRCTECGALYEEGEEHTH